MLKRKASAKSHCDNNNTNNNPKKIYILLNGGRQHKLAVKPALQSHTRDACQTLSQLRLWWRKWDTSKAAAHTDPLWSGMMCWNNRAWCLNIYFAKAAGSDLCNISYVKSTQPWLYTQYNIASPLRTHYTQNNISLCARRKRCIFKRIWFKMWNKAEQNLQISNKTE